MASSSSSNLIRHRAPLMLAAGGIYSLACYIGYTAIQNNKQDIQATTDALQQTPNKSFVRDTNRNQQYQVVSSRPISLSYRDATI